MNLIMRYVCLKTNAYGLAKLALKKRTKWKELLDRRTSVTRIYSIAKEVGAKSLLQLTKKGEGDSD